MNRKTASRARQRARRKAEAVNKAVQKLVEYNREITAGKVTHLEVKCGKKSCRCTRGEKHPAHFLYVARGGPLKRIWIPKKDLASLEPRSERYRHFREDRAKLNKRFKELLSHIDKLEAALTVPYEKER